MGAEKTFIFEGPASYEVQIQFSPDDVDWFDLKEYKFGGKEKDQPGSGIDADCYWRIVDC